MSLRTTPGRLFDLWRRRRDGTMADAADLGTAFGLEVTLIPDDEPAARPERRGVGASWLRRLVRRGTN